MKYRSIAGASPNEKANQEKVVVRRIDMLHNWPNQLIKVTLWKFFLSQTLLVKEQSRGLSLT